MTADVLATQEASHSIDIVLPDYSGFSIWRVKTPRIPWSYVVNIIYLPMAWRRKRPKHQHLWYWRYSLQFLYRARKSFNPTKFFRNMYRFCHLNVLYDHQIEQLWLLNNSFHNGFRMSVTAAHAGVWPTGISCHNIVQFMVTLHKWTVTHRRSKTRSNGRPVKSFVQQSCNLQVNTFERATAM